MHANHLLIAFCYLCGHFLSPLALWPLFLAPKLGFFCQEPEPIKESFTAQQWKWEVIPHKYLGEPKPYESRFASEYEFETCQHRVIESFFNVTTNATIYTENYGLRVNCDAGYQFEKPGKTITLIAEVSQECID